MLYGYILTTTKYRCAAILKPNLSVKFAMKFSISPKIAVSRKSPGGGLTIFFYLEAGCSGGLGTFSVREGLGNVLMNWSTGGLAL